MTVAAAETGSEPHREAYLRDHAFDPWKDDSKATQVINDLLELARRITSPTPDETQGGRVVREEDFYDMVDTYAKDFSIGDVIYFKHPGTGWTILQLIRWIGGLDSQSPYEK